MTSSTSLRDRAALFADRWHGRGDEDSDTQQYWIDLLEHVLLIDGASHDRSVLNFERRTAANGKIDALMTDARVLVEQKSLGVDMDKREPRQGVMRTPVEQALAYANALPFSEKPAVIITCDFGSFRLYDLETDPLAREPRNEFTLDALPDHIDTLARLFQPGHSRVVVQERMGVEAGRRVARLHDRLDHAWRAYRHVEVTGDADHTALAWLTVRLVFCLYAEDAGLFGDDRPFERLVDTSSDLAADLHALFDALDTPETQRKAWQARFAPFPYVDGGLFAEEIDIPPMGGDVSDTIRDIAERFDWSHISPVVFGSLMEETLSHDERRKGGMHYTSVANIHKVIDPLFLDGLKAELDGAEAMPEGRPRLRALERLQERLAGMRFLDPACGSGNFLTETYIQLRQLENRILAILYPDRVMLDLGDDWNPIHVRIGSFAGVEINGFACAVAKTAMWIAEQQMLADTIILAPGVPRLPFTDSANIVQGNALRVDWNSVLSGEDCDIVMGNPPFIGQYLMSDGQKSDMKAVWGRGYDGYLDYSTGWYRKAASYLSKPDARFAFVSTNSITQGQPVPALFKPLFAEGWTIVFAHRSFKWDAQSTDNAGVAVVIIGFTRRHDSGAILYDHEYGTDKTTIRKVANVNGYLLDGPNVFVEKRSQSKGPLSPMLALTNRGSQPTDGGYLTFDDEETYAEAMADPIAAKYVRRFVGANELIKGLERWCLWLKDAEPSDMRHSTFLKTRIENVRAMRAASKKTPTRVKAATPWLFDEDHQPDTSYLCVPRHFSEEREYMTCARLTPDIIVGDSCFAIPDPDGFNFAIIESRMFMAWQKAVGGRLESRCRFSNTVTWNNLPLPALSDSIRKSIIAAGCAVLAARANHPGQSLADLYDPSVMPVDLRKAHEKLDKLTDMAFGADRWLKGDDEARLLVLFAGYARMAA